MSYEFYNPYNFVRTPDRNLTDSFAGDYDPSNPKKKENHSRYWEERYTGTIPVKSPYPRQSRGLAFVNRSKRSKNVSR